MPFKSWGFWQIATMALVGIVALGGAVVAILGAWPNGTAAGLGCIAGAALFGVRYWQGRQRLKLEHQAYLRPWKVNVFCDDDSTMHRWNFGAGILLEAALREVEDRTESQVLRRGFDVRITAHPFYVPGLPGLNMGAWIPDQGTVKLAWPIGDSAPPAARHEFCHVVISRRDGVEGDASEPLVAEYGF
jgi:hypothetical protein